MDYYRKQFPDATPKKLEACQTAANGDFAALRMMFYGGKKNEKIDVVPTFPEKLSGALEREGTVTEEQFQAMAQLVGLTNSGLRPSSSLPTSGVTACENFSTCRSPA